MPDFADRIKLYRTMREMTLEEMAKTLHTQKQVISRYELRQQIPKLDVVAEYAAMLNVSVPWLIGYDNGGPDKDAELYGELCKMAKGLSEDQVKAIMTMIKYMTAPKDEVI